MTTAYKPSDYLYLKMDLYFVKRQFQTIFGYQQAIFQLHKALPHPNNSEFWRDFEKETMLKTFVTKTHKVQYLMEHRGWGIIKTARFLHMSTHTVKKLREEPRIYIPTLVDKEMMALLEPFQNLQTRLDDFQMPIGLQDQKKI